MSMAPPSPSASRFPLGEFRTREGPIHKGSTTKRRRSGEGACDVAAKCHRWRLRGSVTDARSSLLSFRSFLFHARRSSRRGRSPYVRGIRANAPERARRDGVALPRVARATPGVAILKPKLAPRRLVSPPSRTYRPVLVRMSGFGDRRGPPTAEHLSRL